jgi:hypothetical protein
VCNFNLYEYAHPWAPFFGLQLRDIVMIEKIAKKLCIAAFVLVSFISFDASAGCWMCGSQTACYYRNGNGFSQCSAESGCWGNCYYKPRQCPTEPCGAARLKDPADDAKVVAESHIGLTCDKATGASFSSTRSAFDTYQFTGGNELLTQAILKLEQNAKLGKLSTNGAFSFPLADSVEDRVAVFSGAKLKLDVILDNYSGFADYSSRVMDNGLLSVNLNVWQVARFDVEPQAGLTAILVYRTDGNELTLIDAKISSSMPDPKPEYFSAQPQIRLQDIQLKQ